tara:strand:- start:1321 stop:1782 length:462 start_codon:yes stop_codon:yes gene_type:complete
MNELEKLNLQKMITDNDVQDNTDLIRTYKHSDKIRADVNTLVELRDNHKDDLDFDSKCETQCVFIFFNYTDIYNKVKKNLLDLPTLYQFLDCLKKVEDGEQDQHEASFEIGKLLKKMYVDSALKKAERLDDEHKIVREEPKSISWSEYKKQNT